MNGATSRNKIHERKHPKRHLCPQILDVGGDPSEREGAVGDCGAVWWSIFPDKVTCWILGNYTLRWWWGVKWGVLCFWIWVWWPLTSPLESCFQNQFAEIQLLCWNNRKLRENGLNNNWKEADRRIFRTEDNATQRVKEPRRFSTIFLPSFKSLPVKEYQGVKGQRESSVRVHIKWMHKPAGEAYLHHQLRQRLETGQISLLHNALCSPPMIFIYLK